MDMERAGVSTQHGDSMISLSGGKRARASGQNWSERVMKAGDLEVDVLRLEAGLGGRRIPLTRLEFLFLQELIRNAGHSVSKGELLSSVWGYDNDPGSNVVGVCVRRLRAKLGYQLIKTVRGQGYQL